MGATVEKVERRRRRPMKLDRIVVWTMGTKKGHWTMDCKGKFKAQGKAHVTEADEDHEGLLCVWWTRLSPLYPLNRCSHYNKYHIS